MRKLLRTIRLDASDRVVFADAAEPGEWASPGTFLFAGRDLAGLGRKEAVAFRSGFLGIASWGFSTLAVVTEVREEARTEAVEALADALVARLGAPGRAAALPAAEEEIGFAEALCGGHAPGTLVALHRAAEADGRIRERFRTLKPRAETGFAPAWLRGHDPAFSVVETDEPEGAAAPVDLVSLVRGRR